MSLPSDDVDAVVDATSAGVEFDGLRVGRDADGYVFETPTLRRTGLSEGDLRRAIDEFHEYATNWRYWQETVGGEGTARRAFLRWCERAPIDLEAGEERGAIEEPGAGDESGADDEAGAGDEAEAGEEGDRDEPVVRNENADRDALAVLERYEALRDGIDRTWGELLITTRLADGSGTGSDVEEAGTDSDVDESGTDSGVDEANASGERIYEVRHVDDADADIAALDRYDDPRDARDLTTYDERGRYRPLKTAPTLVSGWAFPDLSGEELVETVDFVYPATVANWHRESNGDLDVDHWLETADRQTGIYDLIDELPREAVDWMAEACCVDSQCLRRREWDYEAGDELAPERGDGEFPCREPCSLVIAAARQWTILESENERTWQLELTTSELNQLEELIDAVADGRTDEIREADVAEGANRYRARYLRAKRFDDEGSLGAIDASDE